MVLLAETIKEEKSKVSHNRAWKTVGIKASLSCNNIKKRKEKKDVNASKSRTKRLQDLKRREERKRT